MWMRLPVISLVMILGAVGAEEERKATSEAPLDFSAGFERLLAMGLPDVRGATWAKLEPVLSEEYWGYEEAEWANPLAGKGWALPKPAPEATQQVVIGVKTQRCRTAKEVEELEGHLESMSWNERARWAPEYRETWDPADLDEDCAALAALVEREEAPAEASGRAPFFIFAAQLWQHGHVSKANQLAGTMLRGTDQPTKLIDDVVAMLAARDLEYVSQRFQEGHDWKRYQSDLEALVAKYPRGWPHLGEAVALLQKVRRHAKAPVPVETAQLPPGKEEVSRKLLDDLVNTPLDMTQPELISGQSWILQPPEQLPEIWQRLADEGLDGMLILTNLIGDSHFTMTWRQAGYGGVWSSYRGDPGAANHVTPRVSGYGGVWSSYRGVHSDDPLQAISRPLTRAELARSLLDRVVPRTLLERGEWLWDRALQSDLTHWCRGLRHKNRAALALAYLKEGDGRHQDMAIDVLVKENDPGALTMAKTFLLEIIEKHPASGYEWLQSLGLAQNYLSKRGEEAAAFYAKAMPAMEKKLVEATANGADGQPNEDRQMAKAIVIVTKGRQEGNLIETILEELESGRMTFQVAQLSLDQVLPEEQAADTWPVILRFVAKTKHEIAKPALLQVLANRMYRFSQTDDEAAEAAVAEEREALRQAILVPEFSELWLQWLEDTETLYESDRMYIAPQDSVLSILNALTVDVQSVFDMVAIFDRDALKERMVASAKAVARGEAPAMPWPSVDNLPEQRRAELLEEGKRQPAETLLKWFRTLDDDERLYVYQQIRDGGLVVPIEEAFTYIGKIAIRSELIRAAFDWDHLLDQRLTIDHLKAMISKLRMLRGDPAPVYLRVSRGTLYEGTAVSEQNATQVEYSFERFPAKGVVAVSGNTRRGEVVLFWGPDDGNPLAEGDESQLEALWEEGSGPGYLKIFIRPLAGNDESP